MFDEQAFIARVEAANTDELARILTRPTAEEETALRAYFGDARYQRLHSRTLKHNLSRGIQRERPNVVVIPGLMGSNLTAFDARDTPDPIWVNLLRILAGGLEILRLNEDGLTPYNRDLSVRATGIYKRTY